MRKATLLFLVLVSTLISFGLVQAASCDVEAYFVSPSIDSVIESVIIQALDEAQSEVLIAMYSFTDNEIGAAVIRAYQRGLDVRIILDDEQDSASQGREWPKLIDAGIPVCVEDVYGPELHHKFVVVDSALVITGSYNWSDRADTKNFENVVVIRCPQIAKRYRVEFHAMELYLFLKENCSPGKLPTCDEWQPGDVIIAKLLVNAPGSTSKAEIPNEYFTLLNTTANTVDLRGLTICDEQACWTIPSTMTDAIIVSEDTWTVYGSTYNPNGNSREIALRNTGETVKLKCGLTELDSWSYPGQYSDGVPITRPDY
jgi:hypothetical protein